VNLHHKGHTCDTCYRLDIADEVEVELEHRCVDGICRSGQEKRVTIRLRQYDRLGGDAAAGSGVVLNDNDWPSRSDSDRPINRATMSGAPPGPKPSIKRTGRAG
jgi:hypothetical protein